MATKKETAPVASYSSEEFALSENIPGSQVVASFALQLEHTATSESPKLPSKPPHSGQEVIRQTEQTSEASAGLTLRPVEHISPFSSPPISLPPSKKSLVLRLSLNNTSAKTLYVFIPRPTDSAAFACALDPPADGSKKNPLIFKGFDVPPPTPAMPPSSSPSTQSSLSAAKEDQVPPFVCLQPYQKREIDFPFGKWFEVQKEQLSSSTSTSSNQIKMTLICVWEVYDRALHTSHSHSMTLHERTQCTITFDQQLLRQVVGQ